MCCEATRNAAFSRLVRTTSNPIALFGEVASSSLTQRSSGGVYAVSPRDELQSAGIP